MITYDELSAFVPVFLRTLGALSIIPLSQNISNIGRSFVISFVVAIYLMPLVKIETDYNSLSLVLEFTVGVMIGMPVALVCDLVRSLGDLFDSQRGVSFGNLYDPISNHNSSIVSHISANYTFIVFLTAGFLENLLVALKSSYELLPMNALKVSVLSKLGINLIYLLASLCGDVFKSFIICAFIFLLLDIASVFISKAISYGNFNQEVFLAKTICGFLLLLTLLKLNLGATILSLQGNSLSLLSNIP